MSVVKRKRRVGLLSSGRQDWGILRSTAVELASSDSVDLRVLVGGMGCSERFGRNDRVMAHEGFPPHERLEWMIDGSTAHDDAGRALASVGDALVRQQLDALLLVGDRYETLAAAMAATLLRVPIVHLHGGEETEGAFDNAIRNAITKLSHLHLASHVAYAERIIAMGEDPKTVHVVGAPGLDNLHRNDLATRQELEEVLGLRLDAPLVVVTVHPATLAATPGADVEAACGAMDAVDATYVVTLPNADPGNEAVREKLKSAVAAPKRVAVGALGERRYWGLLRIADAMLGNSSSGLIEAPALHLPVVNVGDRQKGRLRSAAVIDVAPDKDCVVAALRQALAPGFRARIRTEPAPFGDGHAGKAVAAALARWTPPQPPVKRATPLVLS